MERIPDEEHEYLSIDSVEDQEQHQQLHLPVEFLNSINLSAMPPHCLKLKRGVPILLMRDINAKRAFATGRGFVLNDSQKLYPYQDTRWGETRT